MIIGSVGYAAAIENYIRKRWMFQEKKQDFVFVWPR